MYIDNDLLVDDDTYIDGQIDVIERDMIDMTKRERERERLKIDEFEKGAIYLQMHSPMSQNPL